MATRTGRVEKRIPLQKPVQISQAQILGLADLLEKATTENVSAHGIRILTRRPLPLHERLLVTSLIGSEDPKPARVVYCQPLTGDLFGVGLRFQKEQPPRKRGPAALAVVNHDKAELDCQMKNSKLITALGIVLGMALATKGFPQVSRASGPSDDPVSLSTGSPKETKDAATHPIAGDTQLCGPSASSSSAKKPQSPERAVRHKVTLSWNPSVPTTNSARDAVVGYYVYRKTTEASGYDDNNKLNSTPIPDTKCVDTLVEPGRTYFYVTRAISAGGAVSKPSNEAKAVIPDP